MDIEETYIFGLKIIHLNRIKDNRGTFLKVFNKDFFIEKKLDSNFKESYLSVSQRNVIRGMHFQAPPNEHTKLVYLNRGAIIDVVIDIREKSPTYGEYFSIEVSAEDPKMIYIPHGCAHGFKSLMDNTMVTYLQTSCYNQKSDQGIRYDTFGFNWNINKPIISERDSQFVSFNSFKTPFNS